MKIASSRPLVICLAKEPAWLWDPKQKAIRRVCGRRWDKKWVAHGSEGFRLIVIWAAEANRCQVFLNCSNSCGKQQENKDILWPRPPTGRQCGVMGGSVGIRPGPFLVIFLETRHLVLTVEIGLWWSFSLLSRVAVLLRAKHCWYFTADIHYYFLHFMG